MSARFKENKECIGEEDEEVEFSHIPVLLNECIDELKIKPNGVYVDCTLGGAGHSSEILKRLSEGGHLIGIDQDDEALAAAGERLSKLNSKAKISVVKSNFSMLDEVLRQCGEEKADGILMDIGVSSHQFDDPLRGFSYRFDAKLDMRMDQTSDFTAYDVVNMYSEKMLTEIIYKYGEEKWASRIASFIAKARKDKPVETTFELTEIIKNAIPAGARRNGGHPAKRTFQAIRIEVNHELDVLETALSKSYDLLSPKGRLLVISFHSLEDRIIKQSMKKAENPCECPPEFPVCICGKKSKGEVVFSKPIVAGEEELAENPRAKSAKLRVFEGA